jgi:hypothetical protein
MEKKANFLSAGSHGGGGRKTQIELLKPAF